MCGCLEISVAPLVLSLACVCLVTLVFRRPQLQKRDTNHIKCYKMLQHTELKWKYSKLNNLQ